MGFSGVVRLVGVCSTALTTGAVSFTLFVSPFISTVTWDGSAFYTVTHSMKCYSSFSAHGIVWYKLKGRLIGLYEENTKHFKNGTFCGGGFAGNTITSYNESTQFSINIFDASTSNLHNTEEGALKKMVHPVNVMFSYIKQC